MRGEATSEAAAWYGRHAQGGVGLVIVEATNTALFGHELTVENLGVLASAIHAGGALAAIQLFPFRRGQSLAPADISLEQIDDLIAQYHLAACLCLAAGFDGIEPHGAHGYLLNQFFSPEKNARTDAYGGDLPGRMRLARRIVQAVRPVCDEGMLLLYRHTPVGPGYDIADSLVLGQALVNSGVDILDLSPSSIDAPGDRAAPFKPLGIPIVAVNGLDTVSSALEVLNEGRADLIAVGRGLIADPDWPVKVREGRQDEMIACIQCEACHADLRAGRVVACTQWS
jgi:2,4-dienoyl-CoA reductase-like NADH-dependent reductase (Old Yellow Enzyme family)